MKFTKMHGCGNDYVYINGFEEQIPYEKKPELVRYLSDRHFGIGGDGAIFINPSDAADFEMEMWNADGTRAEMCGNGIRCVAKYVYDHGMTDSEHISIVSAGAVKYLELTTELEADGVRRVSRAKVDMGMPILHAADVPVTVDAGLAAETLAGAGMIAQETAAAMRAAGGAEQALVVDYPIHTPAMDARMTCVSMGNPHAVIFVEDPAALDLDRIGPDFEHHPMFPKRTNTEFVKIVDRGHVDMRVYERGTGETLACGTGACATAVACILNDLTDETVAVKLLGGELEITWNRSGDGHVYMIGPATTVFEGEIEI